MDPVALKSSWAVVAKSGDDVPLFFYSHLFLSHPELRELFPVSMAGQRDKLVGALAAVVSNVDQLDAVVPFIQQLGRDHRRFSVVAEHYNAVGASLLATLQHFLGPAWTPQLASEWAGAYGAISAVMVQAAEEAAGTSPAHWPAEVVGVDRRTMDVTVIQVRPSEPLAYAPGQSVAMEIPYRPRRWRYFSPANAPRDDGLIEFHIQLVPGGQVSGPAVRSLRIGDSVRLAAPVGNGLTLDGIDGRDVVMIAGGTGLAPLRAMLEALDKGWHGPGGTPNVHLFHGVRMSWNLYEHHRLSRLAQRPWFDYTPVVSEDPSFPGRRGLIGEVAATSRSSWENQIALVCGSPEMVAHTVRQLTKAGLPEVSIRTEHFGGAHAPSQPNHSAGGQQ
ncbi:globin domain-containing protein [Pseudonocardia sp.]|uniref:globin domain-containing protein n=1 Tax=Pseudonocardia sp. TaxID=60912 RepID=UPI0031FBB985